MKEDQAEQNTMVYCLQYTEIETKSQQTIYYVNLLRSLQFVGFGGSGGVQNPRQTDLQSHGALSQIKLHF